MKLNKRYILTLLVLAVAQLAVAQINKLSLDSDHQNDWFFAPQAEIEKDSIYIFKAGERQKLPFGSNRL